jgi:hypothetical protein
MSKKPITIRLSEDLSDPNEILAKLEQIMRAIRALQAEADYLLETMVDGLIAEGSITGKDLTKLRTLAERGSYRAAIEYLCGRLAD